MPPAAHQPAGDSLWLMMALSTCSLSDATPPDSPLPCNLRLYRFWEQEGSCLCWSVCGKRYFKCFSRWLQARTLAGLLCGDAICAPDTYIHDCVLFHSLLHQLECLKEDCTTSVCRRSGAKIGQAIYVMVVVSIMMSLLLTSPSRRAPYSLFIMLVVP